MASKTFIQIPSNVDNPATLRRFLGELILRLDIAFGNRARSPFMTSSSLDDVHAKLSTVRTTLGTVHATLDSVTATLSTVTAALDTVTSTTQDNVAALDTMQTTVSTITTALDALKVTVATLQTELDSYSGGFNQPAQDSLNFPPAPTIDSSYNKVQVQQLANNVVVLANKIDSLLVVLRNAKIISV